MEPRDLKAPVQPGLRVSVEHQFESVRTSSRKKGWGKSTLVKTVQQVRFFGVLFAVKITISSWVAFHPRTYHSISSLHVGGPLLLTWIHLEVFGLWIHFYHHMHSEIKDVRDPWKFVSCGSHLSLSKSILIKNSFFSAWGKSFKN